ncbi:T9SS type A sorting domain-containing protein [Fluviicola taffensis]|uniref:FG-GAP repeat protein n=1 Tax=Fluviicola taffensis (strain DSM 16823 / NCIMB 13979 / RW262) TaxID=755732 RepID=F2IGK4_FLUTR|nr:T9SS type A sorting domain-containing protein [Fluviicola taffensis]AEA42610.1 FG-GAP repeat protein [Fluviicola taffensis DSM 16823]
MIKVFSSFLAVIISSQITLAQTYLGFEYNPNIPVKTATATLKNPWAGGINYGQFSTIDFNFDGLDDLVIFDRSGDEFILMEHTLTGSTHGYQYIYKGHNYFPSDCKYRSAFVDYDNDGRKDLFTYGIGGVKVYRNIGSSSLGLQWQLVTDILQTDYVGNVSNLFVSASDIPAYSDIDFDGDIDILTFHIGGQNVEYHQNQSMELYGIPDSLKFVLKNQCWGKFSEDPNNNDLVLNQTAYPCENGDIANPLRPENTVNEDSINATVTRHTGSTLLAIDINNNGVMDLILGDVSYPGITLLMNGGTAPNTNSVMISQNHNFPSVSHPASMQLFPAIYWEDVDFDGKKDLIVAPNARTVSENQNSVQFFKNIGTNALPNFVFQENNFLQKEMIDHGLGSIPVLVDENGDGLKDLVVADFIRYKPTLNLESVFQLYRNTGTASNPEFTLVNNDYLGFSALGLGLRAVPTFGDLDGDGDQDLIVGRENGTLVRFTNSAGAGNSLSFGVSVPVNDNTGNPINVVSYAFPQLFDLNKDGLLDLMVGKKTGEISYYQNTGSNSSPIFTLISQNVGQADIASTPDGYASPHFFRVNDTTHLFVGAYNGKLNYYRNIDGHLTDGDTFSLYSSNYLNLDVGLYSSFFVDDIDDNGYLNLFVGQDLGGLFLFEADPLSTSSLSEKFIESNLVLYPNPGNQFVKILVKDGNLSNLKLLGMYNILGQKQPVELMNSLVDVSNLSIGSYYFVIENNGKVEHLNFIKN